MHERYVTDNVVKVDTSPEAIKTLILRGRQAAADYYKYKYSLYKEIYEHGSVS